MSLGGLCDCGMFGLSHFTNHASSMPCSHSLSFDNSSRPRATLIDESFCCIVGNGSMAAFGMCFPDDDNDLPGSLVHLKWASFIVHCIRPLIRRKASAVLLESTWYCRAGDHSETRLRYFRLALTQLTAFYPTREI